MKWTSNSGRYLRSYSTLSLLRSYFDRLDLKAAIKAAAAPPEREILDVLFRTTAGLFALGKFRLDEVELFLTNRYFQDSLGVEILPPAKSLRSGVAENAPKLCEIADRMNRAMKSALTELGLTNSVLDAAEKLGWREALDGRAPGNAYIADFLAAAGPHEKDSETLFRTFGFVAGALQHIAASGLTGELKSANSLFTDKIRVALENDGFAIIENVISADEADTLKALVNRIAEAEREKGAPYVYGGSDRCQRIYNLLNKHETFRDLIQRPLIQEIMEHMFSRDTLHDKYVLCSWHCNIIGPGGEASILHVDAAVPEPLPPWIIRCNINYMLDDFTKENGATQCLPGSHKFCRKPTKEDQARKDLVSMVAPKGSLAIWNGHLWHRSAENRTAKSRAALLGGFAASHLREMCLEENHLRIIDEKVIEGMSPTLRRFIGVDYGIKKGAMQAHPELQGL